MLMEVRIVFTSNDWKRHKRNFWGDENVINMDLDDVLIIYIYKN
jgi:hypothetical protein